MTPLPSVCTGTRSERPLPTEQTAAPSWVCVVPTRSSVLLPRDVTHSAACHIDLHISAALYVEFWVSKWNVETGFWAASDTCGKGRRGRELSRGAYTPDRREHRRAHIGNRREGARRSRRGHGLAGHLHIFSSSICVWETSMAVTILILWVRKLRPRNITMLDFSSAAPGFSLGAKFET